MKWFAKCFKQYADFSGRARRTEYWMFVLFSIIFSTIALIVFFPLLWVFQLVLFIPTLAVVVRRLHDTGKSGWMILIGLIPIIGSIWLLVLMFSEGNPGTNSYGPNPKEVGA